jgi:hypothetical protein
LALEVRTTPTAVSWDGGAGTLNWTDAKNWSNDTLPGSMDDVTINASGNPTIKYSGAATTIQSLSLSNNLMLNAGSITVTGKLTANLVVITATGTNVEFEADGSGSTINGTSLSATVGGAITLPGVASISGPTSFDADINANGSGSSITLANLTSLTGTSTNTTYLRAQGGATTSAPLLTQITSGVVQLQGSSTGSMLNLGALTTLSVTGSSASTFTATGGGTINAPLLTTTDGWNVTISDAGTTPFRQLQKVTNGVLALANNTFSFSNLTSVDGGAIQVTSGGKASFPNLKSFTGGTAHTATLQASGTGSSLSLPALTSFVTAPSGTNYLKALSGATVSVSQLASLPGGTMTFQSDGAQSLIDLPVLASLAPSMGVLFATNGGTLNIPLITAIDGWDLHLGNGGTTPYTQITQFKNATLYVEGGSYSFSGINNLDGGSVQVSNGASATLPSLTSFNGSGSKSSTFQASGAGSSLSLPGLTYMKGLSPTVSINALSGGHVSIPQLAGLAGGTVILKADGAQSLLDMPLLSAIAPATATLYSTNGGTLNTPLLTSLDSVNLHMSGAGSNGFTNLTSFTNGTIFVEGGTFTFGSLTNLGGSSVLVSNGASATLSALTSVIEPGTTGTSFQASGAGSQLHLPALTTFKSAGQNMQLIAQTSGLVDAPMLAILDAGPYVLSATGSGDLEVPALTSIASGSTTVNTGGKLNTVKSLAMQSNFFTRDATGIVTFTSLNADAGSYVAVLGAITADIVDAGGFDIVFNTTAGSMNITGNLTLAPTSVTHIDLGGTTPNTGFNQVVVSGSVTVAGQLKLAYFNGYVPALGTVLQIITGASVSGFFNSYLGAKPTSTIEWTPIYNSADVSIKAGPLVGPRVTAQSPATTAPAGMSFFDLTFSEPINGPSFTTASVTLMGPNGGVAISSVTQTAANVFRVSFPVQGTLGTYTINAGPMITDAAGNNMDQNQNNITGEIPGDIYVGTINLVASPPVVANVSVNGGAVQRSEVTNVTVTFDSHVNLPAMPATAFQLTRQADSAGVNLSASVDNSGMVTVVTLTFTGGAVNYSSLADGRYTLRVLASMVSNANGSLDGNGDGTGGDDYQLVGAPGTAPNLFRFFGDINGDGTVSASDFIQFRQYFGGVNSAFDFDGDGSVSASDFIQFRLRFGGSI